MYNISYEDRVDEFLSALTGKLIELGYDHKEVMVQLPGQKFVPDGPAAKAASKKIVEEVNELLDELHKGNVENLLKEVCDVIYVVMHVPVIYNLPLMPAFNRVHRNNMDKIKHGIIDEHGKLIKPFNHPKVNLKDLVDEKEDN